MDYVVLLIAAGAVWIAGIVAAAVAIQWWRTSGSRTAAPVDGNCGNLELAAAELPVHPATVSAGAEPPGETADALPAITPASALRFPYPTQQWAAPCTRGELPDVDDFFQVECRELYDGGISFYPPVAMESELLVISLGNRDTLVFMLARLISQEVEVDAAGQSRPVVECHFIRRVREDAGRWARALKTAAPAAAIAS